MNLKYRPEIDGLRSIAVLPVILYHAGVSALQGGFIGVDIFFVISGFLITGILARELQDGRFSIIRFYERRARRILPALFTVLLVSTGFAWIVLMPVDFQAFGKSVAATMLFVSNIWFWSTTGYFEPNTELAPLLHTWSLAVEEQFYIFFPIILWVMWRFGMKVVMIALALALLVSLGVMEWGWRNAPSANFYLLPTRAWELMAGGLCSLWMMKRPIAGDGPAAAALAAAGLLTLAASILLIDKTMPFPSLITMAPVGGTCLILLFARPANLAGRLLAMRGPVFIGLISYSAYLWHQPLFAFARYYSILTPGLGVMLGLSLLSLVLAWISWRWIERPFRDPTARLYPGRGAVFFSAAAGMAAFVAIGVYFATSSGLPGRVARMSDTIATLGDNTNPWRADCYFRGNRLPKFPQPACVSPAGATRIDAVVVGDSHSDALAGHLLPKLNAIGLSASQISTPACAPFRGFWFSDKRCDVFNDRIMNYILRSEIQTVFLVSKQSGLMYSEGFDNTVGGIEERRYRDVFFTNPVCPDQSAECRLENSLAVMEAQIRELLAHGKTVIMVYPVPEAGWEVRATYAKLLLRTDETVLATPRSAYEARYAPFFKMMARLEDPHLITIPVAEALCDTLVPEACLNAAEGKIFYVDNNHLADTGADLVSDLIIDRFRAAFLASNDR